MKSTSVAILLAVLLLSVVAMVVFQSGKSPHDFRERIAALESSVAGLNVQPHTVAQQQDNSRAASGVDENRREASELLRELTLAIKELTLVVRSLGDELLESRSVNQPKVQPEVFEGVRVGDHIEVVKQTLGEPEGGGLHQNQNGRLFLRYKDLGTQFVLTDDYRVVAVETIAE